MFYSNYIPVNMNRTECTIYSIDKMFQLNMLLQAYSTITGTEVEGVNFDKGVVTFDCDDTIHWTIPEVFMALEAYNVANESNFSFYVVRDNAGIPQLFVSKQFFGHRILVNALNMKSVLVGQQFLLSKVTSLIDKRADYKYCQDLFDAVSAIVKGSSKILQALIVDKGTPDECLCVNPLTTLYSDVTTLYGVDLLEEFRKVINNPDTETDSVYLDNGRIFRKDVGDWWSPMTVEHCTGLIELYQKTLEKKSSYVVIPGQDYDAKLYFSINKRYLVNADTFECVVIKNQHVKDLLTIMANNHANTSSELFMIWMLAKSE